MGNSFSTNARRRPSNSSLFACESSAASILYLTIIESVDNKIVIYGQWMVFAMKQFNRPASFHWTWIFFKSTVASYFLLICNAMICVMQIESVSFIDRESEEYIIRSKFDGFSAQNFNLICNDLYLNFIDIGDDPFYWHHRLTRNIVRHHLLSMA